MCSLRMKNSVLVFLILLTSISCPKEKKNPFAPSSPFSLIMSVFLGLQNKTNFTPAPGNYETSQAIEIKSPKNDLPIRYTLDGTAPSCTVGLVYDKVNKVSLVQGKYTLQAIECFEKSFASPVGTGEYNITGGIRVSVPAGTYATTQSVTIIQLNPVPLRYTLDGTTPSCTVGMHYVGTPVIIPLGKYTLQMVECVDSVALNATSVNYNITGTFSYGGLINGNLSFITGTPTSYNPTGLDPAGIYSFSSAPALPTCFTLNTSTGVLTGNCNVGQTTASYNFTASRQNGNKEDLLLSANIITLQWVHEAYLKAPNAEASDSFGWTVSISGDTIVVAAVGEASAQTTITNGTTSAGNGATTSGAAYVFRRTGSTWANEAYLKAPNAETGDFFGRDALHIDGETIVVGARGEDAAQTTITNGTLSQVSDVGSNLGVGAAYVFRRTGSTWANEAYLKAPNAEGGGGGTGDQFGYSVSISADTIVVGAWQEDSNQTTITNGTLASANNLSADSGAAYVFRRTGTTWANEAYLKAPNTGAGDKFGEHISISGDTIVVGAILEDSSETTISNGTTASADNSIADSGAAYVFRRTGSIWASEAFLKAPNADVTDYFSHAVSISGDTIALGAYEDSDQTTITNGTVLTSNNSALNSGAVYIFRRTGNTWANEAFLKSPNAETNDIFGAAAVSISGDRIVAGALVEDSTQTTITNGTLVQANDQPTNSSVGAAYAFRRTGNTWANEAYLKAPNAETTDQFGWSVSISGDTIVVGAPDEDSTQITITNGTITNSNNSALSSGAAYVFRLK